jgi:hypothetical protein
VAGKTARLGRPRSACQGHRPIHEVPWRFRRTVAATVGSTGWAARARCAADGDAECRVASPAALPGLPPLEAPEAVRADLATRHRAYTALMAAGRLTAAHRAGLRARRMDPDRARQRGYVIVRPGPSPIDPGADGVPGFYRVHGRWHLAGPAGLAIPVRDAAGRIQALHVRADDRTHGKYRWLSSPNRPGGASSGAPVYVARGTGPVVWITEGPLKADVAAHGLGVPVLGVPGVSVWRRALPVLERLHPTTVVLAFDQDPVPATAAAVIAQGDACARACRAQGRSAWPTGLRPTRAWMMP